jgi:hypothetical protein
MAYISYTDVPLYFGTSANTSTLPSTTDLQNNGVFCQQVQFNYTPNISAVRLLGKQANKNNFNLAGPPNSSLSFSAYVSNDEFNPSDYTGDVGDLGTTFRLGDDVNGISGSGAYMTSFSYTLAPYSPVLIQCDFIIYNPLTISNPGGKIAAETSDPIDDLNFANYGHGAYSSFNGTSVLSDINVVESVQYQFNANRLPVYQIGNYTPSVVEFLTAEQSIQIQGDNIEALVPLTGSNPGNITIDIKNAAGTTLFSTPIDGKITAENISVAGGDLARGSITITELLK